MDAPHLVLDFDQICQQARHGQLGIEQLLDIIRQQQQTIKRLTANEKRLIERLSQYEPQAATQASGQAKASDSSYSLDAETKRRKRRKRRKKSPGRQPTEVKFADAESIEEIYPEGVNRRDCHLVRERAIWRLENNRAIRVGYRIFAGPDGKEPRIPGVTPRCEYGIEILVVLAFMTYIIGLSLDKTCQVLAFFCQLPLSKSQADALLRQLAQHWEGEFELLCDMLVYQAVVYMDETGWKVGQERCSLWAFVTKFQRVFLFGCHKDAATLDSMLPPDKFEGIGVSDDASVYQNRFLQGQKCWAHLLRKAIKLALLYPDNTKYQNFLEKLLAIYHSAKKSAEDKNLDEAARKHKVTELEGQLCELLMKYPPEATKDLSPPERDFANLVEELSRLVEAEELFTFVLVPEVEGTNNTSERILRNPALDRKAGRTNKTPKGAHRRSVIVSVLESLRANLSQFNLPNVLEEIRRWMEEGLSLFAKQWQSLQGGQAKVEPTD